MKKLFPIIVIVLAIVSGFTTKAGNVSLKGYVTINGNKPEKSFCLHIFANGQSLEFATVGKDGYFCMRSSVPVGTQVLLMPHNEVALSTSKPAFFSGYAKIKASNSAPLKIALTKNKIISRKIKIVDDFGMPVANVRINCLATIPFSQTEKPVVNWIRQWSTSSNREGIFELRMVEGEKGTYELSMNSEGIDGNRYIGKLVVSAKETLKSKNSQVVWKVTRKSLTLLVQCVWDPDFSKEPFRPKNLGGNTHRHSIKLNNDLKTETLMNKKGEVRFYDLNPGKYHISFNEKIGPIYSISRKTDDVEIPAGAKKPVKHILSLKPTSKDHWELRGTVYNSKTNKPVAGVHIRCGHSTTHSLNDGTFVLKILSNDPLIVEHEDYKLETFPVPASAVSEPVSLPITHYPLFSGIVQYEKEKPPMLAKIRLFGTSRSFKTRCDKTGKFQLIVKPGVYRLQIKASVIPKENGKPQRKSLSKAVLFDGAFVMPEHDKEQNFKVPNIASTTIHVEWDKTAKNKFQPRILCLLRKSDNKIMASVQIKANADTILYACKGKYIILVAANEHYGTLCGEIEFKSKDDIVRKIKVPKWKLMMIDHRGIPRFGTEATHKSIK